MIKHDNLKQQANHITMGPGPTIVTYVPASKNQAKLN